MKNVRLSPGRWRAACYWMVTPCWGTRLRSPWLWMFLPSHGLSSQPCGRPLLRRIFTDCAARLHHSLAILAWSLLPPCSTLAEHALRACRSRMELPALLRLSGRRGIKLRLTLGGSAGSYPRPGTCHMTKWVTYFSNWISWCPWVMADPCPPPALPPAVLEVSRFPHAVGCFLAALATGWPWLTALLAFQCLDKGYFLNDARTFLAHDASLAVSGSGAWTRATLSPAGSESALITVFLVEGKIVLVSSDTPLRSVPARLLQAPCTRTGGKRTRWLPSFIRLPRDSSSGLPIIPDANVTTVVERAGVWHARLGPLDGTAKATLLTPGSLGL